jgi:thiamine-monophosphate kinase
VTQDTPDDPRQQSGQESGQESGEERLIGLFRPLATDPGAFGLMDDCAVITPPPGHQLVLKTDAVVGTVHFFADDAPEAVAKKALRVNLSDLAAKGARPLGFLLTLAAPQDIDFDWLGRFAAGLGEDARIYNCPLFGGDTCATPGPLTISIAVFGAVPTVKMLLRLGARAGDALVVSGTIGDAALGLALRNDPAAAARWGLDAAERAHLLDRYLLPRPRNVLAEVLRRHASGAMDLSDGLAGDLRKMCRASHVDASVDMGRVPLSSGAKKALAAEPALIEPVLTGGDDYEVLASVPPQALAGLIADAAAQGVTMTEIGRVAAGSGRAEIARDGVALRFSQASYSHF